MRPADLADLRKWAEAERRADLLAVLDLVRRQAELIADLKQKLDDATSNTKRDE